MDMESGLHHWYWIVPMTGEQWFELDIIEQYTTGNSSVLYWKLARYKEPSDVRRQQRIAPTKLTINGTVVYEKPTVSEVSSAGFPAKVDTYVDGTISVLHNEDGNKTIHVEFRSNIFYTDPITYVDSDLELTYIPPVPVEHPLFELYSAQEDGHQFKFYGTETIDTLGNYSMINWTLKHIVGSAQFAYTTVSPITVKIGDTVVYDVANYSPPAPSFPSAAGEVSGTIMIPHEANGKKTVELMLWVAFASGRSESQKVIRSLQLTDISVDNHLVDFILDTPTISGHHMSLRCSESIDLERNGSWISWSLYSTFAREDYQMANYNKVYVDIGTDEESVERVYLFETADIRDPRTVFPNVSGVVSGSIFIQHDQAGDAELYVSFFVNSTRQNPMTYTYRDSLTNTNRNPPMSTVEVEATSQTEASFIIHADVDVKVMEYCKVEGNIWNPRGWWNVGDYCLYYGDLYRCLVAIHADGRPWDPSKWELIDMTQLEGWTADGMLWIPQGNADVRTIISSGLTGNKHYLTMFKIAKMASGIEGYTAIASFATLGNTVLISADNMKLDDTSAVIKFIWSVYKPNYHYVIDIYTKESPTSPLATSTSFSQGTTVEHGTKEVTMPATIKNNAYIFMSTKSRLEMYMLLHTFDGSYEIGEPQRADFIGYIEEANSSPYYPNENRLVVGEANAKVAAYLNGIPDFDPSVSYWVNDIVLKDSKLYKAIANVPAHAWDADEWDEMEYYPYSGSVDKIFIKSASTCRLELTSLAAPRSSNDILPVKISYQYGIGDSVNDAEVEEGATSVVATSSISKIGDMSVFFDAVDSRGFRTRKSTDIHVMDYGKPKIESMTAYRNNHRLGELMFIDANGTQYPLRNGTVNFTKAEAVEYLTATTPIPADTAHDVPGVTQLWEAVDEDGPTDEVKTMIKEVCKYYSADDKYVTEVLIGPLSIESAYTILYHWTDVTATWNNVYADCRQYGPDSSEVTADIGPIAGGIGTEIAKIRKILTGTYNQNYIHKAEIRFAKASESYTSNWVDVTSHITQTDTEWVLECYEDPLIVLDADYIYKMQLRIYDVLTAENKPVTFELKSIPAGAPLMSFQKKMIGINNREPTAALDVYGFDRDNEGIPEHVEGYAIDGIPIVNHIIADYDSGDFHVQMFTNGDMVITCTKSVTVGVSTYVGPLSVFKNVSTGTYPHAFIDVPQLYFDVHCSSPSEKCGVIAVRETTDRAKTTVGGVYLFRIIPEASSSSREYVITVRAVGKWK